MARYAYYTNGVIYDILSYNDTAKTSVEITSANSPSYSISFTSNTDSSITSITTVNLGYLVSDGDGYNNNKFSPLGGGSYWDKKVKEFADRFTKNIERGNVIEVPFYYDSNTGTITANTLSIVREFGLKMNEVYKYKVTLVNDGTYSSFDGETVVTEYVENKAIETLQKFDSEVNWTVSVSKELYSPGVRPPSSDWEDEEEDDVTTGGTVDSGNTENTGTTTDSGTTEDSGSTEDNGSTEVITTYPFTKILTDSLSGSYNTNDIYKIEYSADAISDNSGSMWYVRDIGLFCYTLSHSDGTYTLYVNPLLAFSESEPENFMLRDYTSPSATMKDTETGEFILIAPENKDKIYFNEENGLYYKWDSSGNWLEEYKITTL